jgi:hypothetical protein
MFYFSIFGLAVYSIDLTLYSLHAMEHLSLNKHKSI